jgi:hypothetical protein
MKFLAASMLLEDWPSLFLSLFPQDADKKSRNEKNKMLLFIPAK